MSETLFDYQIRLRDEEVLYLLRAIATNLGIAPFSGVAEPAAQTPPLRVVEVEAPAPAEETTRRPRFDWMANDYEIKKAEELRTGWNARAKAMKDPKAVAAAIAASNEARKYAGRRRKRIETEIKQGRAEIVDGVLYDLTDGHRSPWLAGDFPTK
jgi:hypothetical protein